MEESQKSEAPTESDASTKLDSAASDENQIEADKSGPNPELSDPESTAAEKPFAAVVSDSAEAAANNEFADADLKEEEAAVEKKQNDNEDDNDKKPVEDPLNKGKSQKPGKKIFSVKSIVTALLIVAAFSGFFVFDNKSKLELIKKEQLSASDNTSVRLTHQQKNQSSLPPQTSSAYDEKIKEISVLRDALLQKQEEILELKRNYLKGIDELEKEISDEMQKEGISTFAQAMGNRRVEFGLQTIQRKQLYIRRLEKPLNWIFEACEELLYLKRQARMDLQVAEIASGIDLNQHMRQMSTAAERYKLTADKLSIDIADAQPESLETIWERIDHKWLRNKTIEYHSNNQIIARQICKGEYERLAELTEISIETAKCIRQMRGSDLFLTGLYELTPAAARELFQWDGSWICLNGLRVLSPRVALYLFQWEGNWISLNGLTEFPAEIGEALLQWNGAQLELMGLRYTENSPEKVGIEFLARWERHGGKLFVPDIVRKKIDAFNRERAGA